jgi:hypothetical protein
VIGKDDTPNRVDDLLPVRTPRIAQLLHEDERLGRRVVDRKRDRAARTHARMTRGGGPLEVLRVDVAPAHDDQILEPAGHHELAVVKEAEVTSTQIPTLARKVRSVSTGLFQ